MRLPRSACLGLQLLGLISLAGGQSHAGEGTARPLQPIYARGFALSNSASGEETLQVFRTGDSRQRLSTLHFSASSGVLPGETRVSRPLRRVVLTSTTYLPHFEALAALEAVVGVVDPALISSAAFREALAAGKILPIGQGGSIDLETILKLEPDAVFISAFEAAHGSLLTSLQRARIPVIQTTAFEETHPLGRAEWIIFFGYLLDRAEPAREIFEGIERRYRELESLTAGVSERPRVLTNSPWGGVWFLPGSESYKARLIQDAGAEYALDLPGVATLPLAFEEVFHRARQAGVWIDCGLSDSLSSLVAVDQRYRLFTAVREGRVYHNRGQLASGQGNDLFERGGLHADEVLADHLFIFHPELLPDHTLRYYRRLP